jgi:hypothetical protein
MTIRLRQNTASQEIPLGYFLDSADGDTAMTALSIAAADIRLFKAGASAMASKNSGGATHMEAGLYVATLDATDTNTLGPLVIFVKVAGALAVRAECEVLPAQVYDSLILGTDLLQVDVSQFGNAAGTFAGGRPEVTVNSIAANAITAAATASDFGAEVGTAVWATTARTLTALDEDNTTLDIDNAVRAAIGMAGANLDTQIGTLATAANLAVVDTVVDAILVDTAEIGAAGAGLTALASAANLATVDGVVDSILADTDAIDARLPSDPADQSLVIAATNALGAAITTVDTVVDAIKVTTDKLDDTLEDSGGGSWVFTVAALDNAPSGGGGGGDATEAKQDQIIAALAVVDGNVDSLVASVADLPTNAELATALATSDDATLAAVAGVQADTNDIQDRLPAALVGGRMDASVGAMAANVMTAAATAADFVAELAGGGGDAPTAQENAAAVWAHEIENNFSAESSMRLQNAALFGRASGLETTEARYRDPNDTTDRIVATVDLDGNRTAVSLDAG